MYTYLQQALPRVVILKYISQVILITGLYQRFLWWIPWSVFLSLIKHLLSSKEEMEVASTVQPYEGEPRRSNEDFYEDWLKRLLACSVQVKIRAKNTRYWIFSLLRLCFVFYGEIYDKNGKLCSFLLP